MHSNEMENFLSLENNLLELVISLAGIGYVVWNAPASTLAWSNGLECVYGIPSEQLPHTREAWFSLIYREDRKYVKQQIGLAIAHHQDYSFECRLAEHSNRWISVKGHLILDTKGEVSQVIEVTTDVTERRRAEDSALNKSTRWMSLLQHTSDLILHIERNAEGHYVICYVTPSVETLLGYSTWDLINSNLCDLIHPADQAQVKTMFSQGAEGVSNHAEFRCLHRDNQRSVYVEAIAEPLPAESQLSGLVVTLHDITERKRITETLALVCKGVVNA